MKTTESTNYGTYRTYNDIWNYGHEAWCNLEGRYTHIVADLSHLAGQGYSMELCSVGIMGTQYVRDEPLPETLEIASEGLTTLTIPNIYSSMPIGNQLNINMRQASGVELSFISLIEESSQTQV